MTRLAIIDVIGGQQPIYNETGTVALVCNGEIYNHAELRRELELSGHRFRTKSDVETILHLYEDAGEACFERLNGMFGVAIADFERNRVLLARDPFGQKSLYLWRGPTGWAFASELKALTVLPGFSRRPSTEATAAFMQFRYVPAPLTIFEGVEKLVPGSLCVIEPGAGVRRRRYFQIDFGPEAGDRRSDLDGTLTRSALIASVERHLMSERPLGVFLSGGLDSSAVVASMHLNGHRDIRTFTVGFQDFWDNELDAARAVARHYKTDHHEILLDHETFWDSLNDVVYSADEPLADLTTVPLYHLAKRASREVTVVLSGEGSDELLAGYAGLERLRGMFQRHARLQPLSPIARTLTPLWLPAPMKRKLQTLTGSAADYLARTHAGMTNVFPADFIRRFATNGLKDVDVSAPLRQYYQSRPSWDAVHLYLGGLIEWWLPDDLLHKADRMTMAHSLEPRCPFLDVEFARHCAGLDLDSKVRSAAAEPNRKTALKRAFMRLLPDGLALREKRGFSLPAYEWIRTCFKQRMEGEMMRADAFGNSTLALDLRRDLLDRAVGGDTIAQRRVWSLTILNRWADVWL